MTDPNWRTEAACNSDQVDPAWFDTDGKGMTPVLGLRVCGGCPVRLDCLLEALEVSGSDDYGVWGGTTPNARHEIRMRRSTIPRAIAAGDRLAKLRTSGEQADGGAAA